MVVVMVVVGRVRVLPLLHLQQVQVGHMVMLVVLQAHHLHLAQAQAQQKALEAGEAEPVTLPIALEELLDVEVLFLLCVAGAAHHRLSRGFHVGFLGYLQVAVDLIVFIILFMIVIMIAIMAVFTPTMTVAMVVVTASMAVVMSVAVAMAALVKQEGEHTQEAEFGVCVDPHLLVTSRRLDFQKKERKENTSHIHLLYYSGVTSTNKDGKKKSSYLIFNQTDNNFALTGFPCTYRHWYNNRHKVRSRYEKMFFMWVARSRSNSSQVISMRLCGEACGREVSGGRGAFKHMLFLG